VWCLVSPAGRSRSSPLSRLVQQLREANGGAEPEIGVFTSHVEADQGIEIARMRELYARLR
jgi:hypothetical protein